MRATRLHLVPDELHGSARRSTNVVLRAGAYRAEISPVGAALVSLSHRQRPLLAALDTEPPLPRFRGAVLAPWPNRIRDGRYDYDGRTHQLAITETERGCALHGLLLWHDWTVEHVATREVLLTTVLRPRPGYPFQVEVSTSYLLDERRGLRIVVGARNRSRRTALFGTSMHPYLVAGDGMIDDWTLRLPADTVTETDDRLLPVGTHSVTGTDLDFRDGRRLGRTRLDHAFGRCAPDDDGLAAATLTAADGSGVLVEWDAVSPWVQVCTGDDPDPRMHRRSVAIEPMTCPPDAFNSGVDVWHLAPDTERSVCWRIARYGS